MLANKVEHNSVLLSADSNNDLKKFGDHERPKNVKSQIANLPEQLMIPIISIRNATFLIDRMQSLGLE